MPTDSPSRPPPGNAGAKREFFRYEDPQGKLIIVDDEGMLPPQVRGKAERIVIQAPSSLEAKDDVSPSESSEQGAFYPTSLLQVDGGSFGLGFGAGLLLGGILLAVVGHGSGGSGARRLLLGSVLVVALGALAAGAYLGWVRRAVGLGSESVASPAQLVDDAREAVEGVQKRRRDQAKQLDEIERLAK